MRRSQEDATREHYSTLGDITYASRGHVSLDAGGRLALGRLFPWLRRGQRYDVWVNSDGVIVAVPEDYRAEDPQRLGWASQP